MKNLSVHQISVSLCPCCGKYGRIKGGQVEINDKEARQECSCSFCDSSWTDVYVLNNTLLIEDCSDGE